MPHLTQVRPEEASTVVTMDEANPRAEAVDFNMPGVIDVHNHPGLSDVCERRSVRSGEQLTGVPQVMDMNKTMTHRLDTWVLLRESAAS